jgi:enoyl-[acyl-carrier protein] reductase/trans-2-enoyl-CoA reductase (NAD+)
MKDMAVHEDCLRQIDRLFRTRLYGGNITPVSDAAGRLRVDDWELREDVQREVRRRWRIVNSDNVVELSDLGGYGDKDRQRRRTRRRSVRLLLKET